MYITLLFSPALIVDESIKTARSAFIFAAAGTSSSLGSVITGSLCVGVGGVVSFTGVISIVILLIAFPPFPSLTSTVKLSVPL